MQVDPGVSAPQGPDVGFNKNTGGTFPVVPFNRSAGFELPQVS